MDVNELFEDRLPQMTTINKTWKDDQEERSQRTRKHHQVVEASKRTYLKPKKSTNREGNIQQVGRAEKKPRHTGT